MTDHIKVTPEDAAQAVKLLLELADRATVEGKRNNAVIVGSPLLGQIYRLSDRIAKEE